MLIHQAASHKMDASTVSPAVKAGAHTQAQEEKWQIGTRRRSSGTAVIYGAYRQDSRRKPSLEQAEALAKETRAHRRHAPAKSTASVVQ